MENLCANNLILNDCKNKMFVYIINLRYSSFTDFIWISLIWKEYERYD